MWLKLGLLEQGMYREQENSHLEWPIRLCVCLSILRSDDTTVAVNKP